MDVKTNEKETNTYKLKIAILTDKNIELQQKIENAINCIKWHYDLGTKEDIAFCWLRDNLLKILGDKENERNRYK